MCVLFDFVRFLLLLNALLNLLKRYFKLNRQMILPYLSQLHVTSPFVGKMTVLKSL